MRPVVRDVVTNRARQGPAFCVRSVVKYGQTLLISRLGQLGNFRCCPTADWMLDHDKGIVWQTKHPRNVLRGYLKRFGANHDRSFAELLEAYAIMQTAR